MMIADATLIAGAYIVAFLIRFGGFPKANWDAYLPIGPVIVLATLSALAIYRGYRDLHRPVAELLISTEISVWIGFLIGVSTAYFNLSSRAVPRSVLIIGALLTSIALPALKLQFARSARIRFFERPTAIIYSRTVTLDSQRQAQSPHLDAWHLRLPPYIRAERVLTPDELLVSPNGETPPSLLILLPDLSVQQREVVVRWATKHGADVVLIPELYDLLLSSGSATTLGDVPVVALHRAGASAEHLAVKRLVDILVAALLLVVFLPVIIVISLGIWIFDGRPVLYRQNRVGLEGRIFQILKFRTMARDAERHTGAVWASRDDPRITRVGRILRASRLDELPQLFNVLRGDMSLVGPRPERPELLSEFEARNPLFRLRNRVKPGLTGLAQVLGRYDTHPDDKLRFDLMYITRYSLWLDIQILLWTVAVVLFPQSWVDSPPALLRSLAAAVSAAASYTDGEKTGSSLGDR